MYIYTSNVVKCTKYSKHSNYSLAFDIFYYTFIPIYLTYCECELSIRLRLYTPLYIIYLPVEFSCTTICLYHGYLHLLITVVCRQYLEIMKMKLFCFLKTNFFSIVRIITKNIYNISLSSLSLDLSQQVQLSFWDTLFKITYRIYHILTDHDI